jgi:hypothetical protein
MTVAQARVVKLEMAMSVKIGGPKLKIRQQVQEQLRHQMLAKKWKHFRYQLADGARKTFVFLLGATVLVVLLAYETELQQLANAKVSRVASGIEEMTPASRLRQDTAAYENEVNEIAQ